MSNPKAALLAGAITALLATCAWAGAINTTRSNTLLVLSRSSIVTASTDISGDVATLVYRTPAARDFVMTQACAGRVTGGILLQIDGVSIAHVESGQCQTFSPGLSLPPDHALTCTKTAPEENTFCTITGLLGPAPRPTPPPPN